MFTPTPTHPQMFKTNETPSPLSSTNGSVKWLCAKYFAESI